MPSLTDLSLGFRNAYLDHARLTAQLQAWADTFPSLCRLTSIARTPEGPRLIGITEASSAPTKRNPFFFVACGLKGFPSLHTRVFNFTGFIQANLST